MPPKRKPKAKKAKVPQQANNELAQITRMLKNMNQPQSQVTDLGRLLLKGGNMVSGVLGFPKVFGQGSYTMTNYAGMPPNKSLLCTVQMKALGFAIANTLLTLPLLALLSL